MPRPFDRPCHSALLHIPLQLPIRFLDATQAGPPCQECLSRSELQQDRGGRESIPSIATSRAPAVLELSPPAMSLARSDTVGGGKRERSAEGIGETLIVAGAQCSVLVGKRGIGIEEVGDQELEGEIADTPVA